MKRVMLAVLALLMFAVPAIAQKPAGATYHKGPFIKRAIVATAACGVGIGLSGNPATAAEIGLPILFGGNALAYKLDRSGHPKWSAFVQTISPLGCWMHYGSHKVKPQVVKNRPPVQDPSSGPTGGSGGTNGSGNGGSGSGAGSGSGDGGGSGSGGSGSGGGTGGTGNGGSGSGGTGGGSGGSGGSGGGTQPPKCIKDCGFPGNGGVNGGNDGKKPPFPGKGNGGSNIGNGGKGKNVIVKVLQAAI